MIADFLVRLAIALPLMLVLMVGTLLAMKRGWLRLPAFARQRMGQAMAGEAACLRVVQVKALSSTAQVAVVRFAGNDHLIGTAGQTLLLLATAAVSQEKA